MMKNFFTLFVFYSLFCSLSFANQERPKLLVMIVIDQFRADYLMRFRDKFLPEVGANKELGGFEYLMKNGSYFPFGEFQLAQCITAPGHATVLTGAYPFQSGIPLNEWYNRETQRVETSVEDTNFSIVGDKDSEQPQGASPKNLIATTVGDELKNAGYPSRVVSVALKDRAAILLGGHRADLALWYNTKANQWVTSQYYLPNKKFPQWVSQLNDEMKPHLGEVVNWNLGTKQTGYSDPKSKPFADKSNAGKIGVAFPHQAKIGTSGATSMPYGLTITRIAAERAIDSMQLGRGQSSDLLGISFSSHDIVGHAFGPNSREMEEMTYAEDKEISHLLNYLKSKIPGGLKNVVIALTADHGVAPSPEWASAHQIKAGRIDLEDLGKQISAHLNEKYGKPNKGDWTVFANSFNLYLNHPAILDKKLNLEAVEAEAKSVIQSDPRLSYVVTSAEIKAKILPPGIYERTILNSYYSNRSGDLLLVPKPYYISGEPSSPTANHGTGYSYDRTVPILFSGFHIRHQVFATPAEVIDIAPTFSFLAGTIPPSLSTGRVLSEILIPAN